MNFLIGQFFWMPHKVKNCVPLCMSLSIEKINFIVWFPDILLKLLP